MHRNCQRAILALAIASVAGVLAQAQPLEIACPSATSVRCERMDDLDATGRVTVAGGCGDAKISYMDSVVVVDSTVYRRWTVTDTCGAAQQCVQAIHLIAGAPRIAVLPLENLAESEEGARVMVRLLEDALLRQPGVELIPAGQVDEAIMRGRVRQPFLMDDDQRARLTVALDASYYVVGSLLNYSSYDDAYSGRIPIIACAFQLQRSSDGRTIWSETVHAVGSDGEWLFGLGVEHDITRLAGHVASRAVQHLSPRAKALSCIGKQE
jgi:hypothetical protein